MHMESPVACVVTHDSSVPNMVVSGHDTTWRCAIVCHDVIRIAVNIISLTIVGYERLHFAFMVVSKNKQ